MKRVYKILLLVIWASLIFYLSGQNGPTSKALSESLLVSINKSFISSGFLRALIRKMAHIFEYAVLGILAYINVKDISNDNQLKWSVIFCFVYALSDEIHQHFIPGRNFAFYDVILDTIASLLAIVFFIKLLKYFNDRNKTTRKSS